jgi:hypothetical protein
MALVAPVVRRLQRTMKHRGISENNKDSTDELVSDLNIREEK